MVSWLEAELLKSKIDSCGLGFRTLTPDHIHLVWVGHFNPNPGDWEETGLLPWSLWQESNGQFNVVQKMWKLGSWPMRKNIESYC